MKIKEKAKTICSVCGTDDMYVTLSNGERRSQYCYNVASGKVTCMPCKEKQNVNK